MHFGQEPFGVGRHGRLGERRQESSRPYLVIARAPSKDGLWRKRTLASLMGTRPSAAASGLFFRGQTRYSGRAGRGFPPARLFPTPLDDIPAAAAEGPDGLNAS